MLVTCAYRAVAVPLTIEVGSCFGCFELLYPSLSLLPVDSRCASLASSSSLQRRALSVGSEKNQEITLVTQTVVARCCESKVGRQS